MIRGWQGGALVVMSAAVVSLAAQLGVASGSWEYTQTLSQARWGGTATLLDDGAVLVTGGATLWGEEPSATTEIAGGRGATTTPGPDMGTARMHHTATRLLDGRVLVCGGWAAASGSATASCTRFDPTTGTWLSTSRLITPRAFHTATLLRDGRVLVAGGYGGLTPAPLRSTEVYDPVANDWNSAGTLTTGRHHHTATLLADGDVLVVGGSDAAITGSTPDTMLDATPLESCEIYSGAWAPTNRLGTGRQRQGHVALALEDGDVLVAGGWGGSAALANALRFDGVLHTWSVMADDMTHVRESPSACLLPSGEVLVAGGRTWVGGDWHYLTASWGLWSPTTETWTEYASEGPGARAEGIATVGPDGTVTVIGPGKSCYRFTNGDHAWASVEVVPVVSYQAAATLLADGRVLVSGGRTGPSEPPSTACWIFDPASDEWTGPPHVPALNVARAQHAATLLPDGRVLVAGGMGASSSLASAEIFDGVAWELTTAMPGSAGLPHAVVLPDGSVLVGSQYRVDLFDPAGELWTTVGSLANAMDYSLTRLHDGSVLLAGGIAGTQLIASGAVFHPERREWSDTGPMVFPRRTHNATLLLDGRVLVSGGSSGVGITACEIFDPSTSTWAQVGSLTDERVEDGAALLPDGRVLVAGAESTSVTAELFDPATAGWSSAGATGASGRVETAVPLPDGRILFFGSSSGMTAHPVFVPASLGTGSRRPAVDAGASATTLTPGSSFVVTVNDGFGPLEASDGSTRGSASNLPVLSLAAVDGGRRYVLGGALGSMAAPDGPLTLSYAAPPADLDVGHYLLCAASAGVTSKAVIVNATCGSPAIITQPTLPPVPVDATPTLTVVADLARSYQWQRCNDGPLCSDPANWDDVAGATDATFTTDPVTAPDSGLRFRVEARGTCFRPGVACAEQPSTCALSNQVTLVVDDDKPPAVDVLAPDGGEYWLLSSTDPGEPERQELVSWSMADDVRVCRVDVFLEHSEDGGSVWTAAPWTGPDPPPYGSGGTCVHPGVSTSSALFTVPTTPPSGSPGSLYRIRVRVTDHAGNATTAFSANPFFIVQSNPDSVDTLILADFERMVSEVGATVTETASVATKLGELADHPRVLGRVVDLGGVTALAAPYAAWDAAVDAARANPSDPALLDAASAAANAVVAAVHNHLLALLDVYSGVENVVIVGDDRVIPFARLDDGAGLLPESTYPALGDLSPGETSVGQALAADRYLSDDALAVLDAFTAETLGEGLFLPDLAVGRLVESPTEIITTVATFISADGVLDLSILNPVADHMVQVTGYDFLLDSAAGIRARWKTALGAATPDASLAPVDGSLLSATWDLPDADQRRAELFAHLAGNDGAPYAVLSLNGHANHWSEGVPGADPHDIEGLGAVQVYGADGCASSDGPLAFPGALVYAVGCHSGLPVAGSCSTDAEHSLDLAQSFLARGALGYLGNTGYGWGLVTGIGYGERVVEIFTEELTAGGTPTLGELVRATKQRYVLEAPRLDPYDAKSLMQWTLYGLPMTAVRTGMERAAARSFSGPAPTPAEITPSVALGPLRAERRLTEAGRGSLPSWLTRLEMSWDLTAPGVYSKRDSLGALYPEPWTPGCPDPAGCYYTLNGLVERGSGSTDLPIQPYLVFDSRLSGTSQHGVLWTGGTYVEEDGWVPVIAELASNGGDASNHGSIARVAIDAPTGTRNVYGADPVDCRATDHELNGLVVTTGEALRPDETSPEMTIQRRYHGFDVEVLYYNNTYDGAGNCDREGPLFGLGPYGGSYHTVNGATLTWAVPVSDASGVWRVVVVYSDNTVDDDGLGAWTPLELYDSGSNWQGILAVADVERLTYVIQAVDRRGNVSCLEYEAAEMPASGVDFGIPLPVDVDPTVLFADGFESAASERWSATTP